MQHWFKNLIHFFQEIGLNSLVDILFMTLFIYTVIVVFKRTRAAFVMTGILILGGVYLLTRQFNMVMTASVFEKFFAVILVILVVIFQEELKHFFEEVAVWSLNRRLLRKKVITMARQEVETLVRTLFDLARARIGALVIIKGNSILNRHLEGEIKLDGEVSEPLLKSIFDPHSIGHDGAVIIEGNRVSYFSCHLPLSKNLKKIKDRGTRHAAGLGLSELTDSLCLIISEEQGTITLARKGDIQVISDPERLTLFLENFYEEINPRQKEKPWEEFLKKNSREKIYAFCLAIGLWFVLVNGAKVTYKSYKVPVSYVELPSEWAVTKIRPIEVEATFRGPRTAFYFNINNRVKVYPDFKKTKGEQRIRVHSEDFVYPKGIILENFNPHYIDIVLDKKVAANGKTQHGPK